MNQAEQFLYPRTIAISRPPAQPDSDSSVGDQGEAPSSARADETPVMTGLPANIELRGRQGKNPTGLPGDSDQDEWDIRIPLRKCPLGTILSNDVITDDLGERYIVSANYWNSLGYAVRALKEKA